MIGGDSLSSRIANEIVALAAVGELGSNAHLNTKKLAARFEVSRTPVRDALALLEQDGFVKQHLNRGFFLTAKALERSAGKSCGATLIDSGPPAYYKLAEDWLADAVPDEVTEQFLMESYSLTKAQLTSLLNRGVGEGWMERKPGYGWRLLPVAKTPEAQAQLYRMRLLLEPAGLLEPTFQLDRVMLDRLQADLQRVRDGAYLHWPADKLHAVGVSFHEELMRMSGNPFLHQAIQRVNRMRRLLEYRSMIDRVRVLAETNEHLEILKPLSCGDLVETSFLMRSHVARALDRKRTQILTRP